jgi:hypothetical protein
MNLFQPSVKKIYNDGATARHENSDAK